MVVNIGVLPKFIRSFSFSPKAVLSDVGNTYYLIGAKEEIFGYGCIDNAEKLGIDLFDLVFVNEKPFCDCCGNFLEKCPEDKAEVIKTAIMLKKIHRGDIVTVADITINGDVAQISGPEPVYIEGIGRNMNKTVPELNRHGTLILESVRLAALRYTMKRCMEYKELVDKYNYRRFSRKLRLNNRPADIEEIKAAMAVRKDRLFADFSRDNIRINFSMLYAIAYGGYTMDDIFSREKVFDNKGYEREKRLSDLSGDLLTILYNANGIEISSMLINLIVSFTRLKLPEVDLTDLDMIIENYPVYYAIANLAAILESIFSSDSGRKAEMKQYLKRHTLYNYWTVNDRLMLMKQYSTVVSFCYKLANFDVELYREDPEYQGSVLYAYESAQKFSEELKQNE